MKAVEVSFGHAAFPLLGRQNVPIYRNLDDFLSYHFQAKYSYLNDAHSALEVFAEDAIIGAVEAAFRDNILGRDELMRFSRKIVDYTWHDDLALAATVFSLRNIEYPFAREFTNQVAMYTHTAGFSLSAPMANTLIISNPRIRREQAEK